MVDDPFAAALEASANELNSATEKSAELAEAAQVADVVVASEVEHAEVHTDVVVEVAEDLAPAVDEDVTLDDDGQVLDDPLAEFRRALHNAPGDWFVIHSYAGYENRVKGIL
jgi:transcriptional antiterminator NusG